MERAEKIKLLRHYNDIEKMVVDLNDRYLELYTASTKITPTYGKEGGGGSGYSVSKVETNCIKLLEIDLKGQHYADLKNRVDKAMMKLTYLQRNVIQFTDIDHHSLYECAKAFRRTTTNIKRIRERALDSLDI